MNEVLPAPSFDREFALAELIADIPRDRLQKTLILLLGGAFRIVDDTGRVLIGAQEAPAGAKRAALTMELEPIGYLETASADDTRLKSAVALLELLFRGTARYKMASSLHIESVQADFEKLKQQHAALEASEARYKALSKELEQRVQDQVQLIDEAHRQLYQAEKMASVGRLAAGVAHEINNPIGFVRSNLSTAQTYLGKLGELRSTALAAPASAERWQALDMDFVLEDFADLLKESVTGIDRVARIVADLKGVSNIDRGEAELADLNEGLRQACSVLAGQLPADARLIQDLTELPRLTCLAGYLNQAFHNVLRNAVQAIEGRADGEIRVHSGQEGQNIIVRVSDNGCGIPPDDLPRIFEPFFTTRPVGSGTGLGLTVVQDTLRLHGGRVEVQSEVGQGSTVSLILPI